MSKFDYDKSADTALKLIDKFGTDCSLRKNEGTPIDVNKPWLGETNTEVGYPTTGVLLPLSNSDQSLYPELTTVKGMSKILLESVNLTVDPQIADMVLFENEYWIIEAVKLIKPATTKVLWTLIVSR